jgi:hypothetical protein
VPTLLAIVGWGEEGSLELGERPVVPGSDTVRVPVFSRILCVSRLYSVVSCVYSDVLCI